MPKLTIIAAFFNMAREAHRTLYSLSAAHQRGVSSDDYRVVALDNGSSEPLDPGSVSAHGPNFEYRYIETASKTPTPAINAAVASADTDYVLVMIDGARMATPGIVRASIDLLDRWDNAVVYAPSFHLGAQLQNDLVVAGYNQQVEDELLSSVDWRDDGYQLYAISNARAVPERFGRPTFESNCFAMRREQLLALGGYDDRFVSSGGGIVNWELFGRLVQACDPVMVLQGEATFHQFHGGASTNHTRRDHPIRGWLREHESVTGRVYRYPEYNPIVVGQLPPQVCEIVDGANASTIRAVASMMLDTADLGSAIALLRTQVARNPNNPEHLGHLAKTLVDVGRLAEADLVADQALATAPTQAELHALKARIHRVRGEHTGCNDWVESALELDPLMHAAMFERALSQRDQGHDHEAVAALQACIEMAGPPHGPYEMQLAAALAATGDLDGAWQRGWKWVCDHPGDSTALGHLAELAAGGVFGEQRTAQLSQTLQRQIESPIVGQRTRVELSAAIGGIAVATTETGANGDDATLANASARQDPSTPAPAEAAHQDFVVSVISAHADRDQDEVTRHALEGSISLEEAAVLAERLAVVRPARILEVGTFLGLGSRQLLDASAEWAASVTTVDPGVRHRVFEDPLGHAIGWVGGNDRLSAVRAYFGVRTGAMAHFDYATFAPVRSHQEVDEIVASVPVARFGPAFDLVFLDPGPVDEFAALVGSAILAAVPDGEIIVRTAGDSRLVDAANTTAAVARRTVADLSHGLLLIAGERGPN